MTDPLERAVREHLDRVAAGVDASAMVERVRKTERPRSWRRTRRRLGAGLGVATIAAAIAGVLLFNPMPTTQLAAAEQLLRDAQTIHAQPIDRRYEVVTDWDVPLLKRFQLPNSRAFSVWTRGNEFFVENTAESMPTVAMGQSTDGRIWMALTRKRGLIYEPMETNEPLARLCDLVSLRTLETLREALEQFTLFRKDTGQPGEPIRIEAKIRPNFLNRNPQYREIQLELDPQTKVIRYALLKRMRPVEGEVAFRLLETRTMPDEAYTLRGHLDADAVVVDRSEATKLEQRTKFRDEWLKRLQNRK